MLCFVMTGLSRLRHRLKPWGQALLDVIFPRTCRVCDQLLRERDPSHPLQEWFCPACEDALPLLEAPYCQVCAEPYDGAAEALFRCSNCAERKFAFEFAVAGYRAQDEVRELIHKFKYNHKLELRGALADLLHGALLEPRLAAEDLKQWTLVPVPLHRARERQREFNQSWEMCRELARRTGIPAVNAMKRQRATGRQTRLTRAQRLQNLRSAFAMKRRFAGANSRLLGPQVLLVDDVFTTGATAHECARVLRKEAGVQKVVVIAVARG